MPRVYIYILKLSTVFYQTDIQLRWEMVLNFNSSPYHFRDDLLNQQAAPEDNCFEVITGYAYQTISYGLG